MIGRRFYLSQDAANILVRGRSQLTILFDGVVMADYHQFYLADTSRAADLPSSWRGEAFNVRLLAGGGALVVLAVRNMDVALVVELREHMPEVDVEKTDHGRNRHSRAN
ncbi:hypothetical protein [Ensifer sp. 4252]|uniref:hypothetical protein n=1 Tax=Ensifer sp. 4252 TaxID=3373915 RepID=UPI003D1D344E